MNARDFDVSKLLSLPLSQRKTLPSVAAVYFVVVRERVVYVGQSTNLQYRWQTHNKLKQLVSMGEDIRIAWIECDKSELLKMERSFIETFKPILNNNEDGKQQDRITLDLQDLREAVESAYTSSLWHELSMPQKVRYIVKAFLGLVEPSEEMALPHHRSMKAIKRFCDGWDLQKLERASGIPSERLLEFRSGQWSRVIDANEATGLIRAGIAPEDLKAYFEKEIPNGNNGS